jgi:beta-mannanase
MKMGRSYYGVHVPGWLSDLSAVTAFESNAKKPASIVMWYQGWGLTDGTQHLQPTWMENVREHGAIPLVTWEPWLYTQGISQPAYSLQKIMNGDFDAYITKWAADSKAWGHPCFLRFAHEMNGNWYPWSELMNANSSGQYVQTWRHVHDLFTKQGVTNVTWVWSPNIEYAGSISLYQLYPGDSYVDWIGLDGYNWGSLNNNQWKTFAQVFEPTYRAVLELSPAKPLMIAEMATTEEGGDKAAWISDAYMTQLPASFPKIRAVVWFNENKETDWRIESSPAAQSAFANALASGLYASNEFARLTSPIPIAS